MAILGVIAEVSSICGLCGSSVEAKCVNFVQDGPSMVSTSVLNDFVTEWLASLNACNAEEQADRIARMVNVVKHVMSLQDYYFHVWQSKEGGNASVGILRMQGPPLHTPRPSGGLIDVAQIEAMRFVPDSLLMNPQIQQSFPARWDELKDFASKELLASGWCRSEGKLLERMDGSYNFFATCVPRWPMDHSRCNDFMCLADQINENHYVQAHVEPHCRCESVVLDPEKLRSILEKGKVPRVFIEDDDKLTVSEDHHYVAISHVCECYSLSFIDSDNPTAVSKGLMDLGTPTKMLSHCAKYVVCVNIPQVCRGREHVGQLFGSTLFVFLSPNIFVRTGKRQLS